MLFWDIAISNPAFYHAVANGFKSLPPIEKFIESIKKSTAWNEISKRIPTKSELTGNAKQKQFKINEFICAYCLLVDYTVYMEALGIDPKIQKKFDASQRYPELIRYILKHMFDEDYGAILRYVRKM